MIAFAEGEKELVFLRKTVVDTHRPGCVQDRVDCRKREVVDQAIIVSRGRGNVWFWYEFHYVLSDGAKGPTNLVSGERLAALYAADCLSRGWVENLTLKNGVVVVTRICPDLCTS